MKKYIDVVKPTSFNQVIYDENDIKITITGYQTNEDNVYKSGDKYDSNMDGEYMFCLNCNIENKSNQKINARIEDIRINDRIFASVYTYSTSEVEAGATVSDRFGITAALIDEPYNINFGDIKKIDFTFNIKEGLLGDVLYTSDTITLNLK